MATTRPKTKSMRVLIKSNTTLLLTKPKIKSQMDFKRPMIRLARLITKLKINYQKQKKTNFEFLLFICNLHFFNISIKCLNYGDLIILNRFIRL